MAKINTSYPPEVAKMTAEQARAAYERVIAVKFDNLCRIRDEAQVAVEECSRLMRWLIKRENDAIQEELRKERG